MDRRPSPMGPQAMEEMLSKRERQLLALSAKGYTDNGIAHELGISIATVGTYWGRIRIKFGPLNRTELVAVFLREEATRTIDQLRSENEKLIRDLQDHAKTASMLRASLELFKGLLETAPDAIILVSERGYIELANEQAETLFGYGQGEMVGISIEDLVPEELRSAHVNHRKAYHSDPIRRPMGEHLATSARRKDGSIFQMATALSAIQTARGLLVTCIVRDLSDKVEKHAMALGRSDSRKT